MKVMIRAMNREEIRNEKTSRKPGSKEQRENRPQTKRTTANRGPGVASKRRPNDGDGRGRRADTMYDRLNCSNSISRETITERPGLNTIYVSMHSSGSQASPLLSQQYPKGLPRDPHLSDRSTPVRTGSTRRAPAYLW